jgi:AcrR family transcriptional regulator
VGVRAGGAHPPTDKERVKRGRRIASAMNDLAVSAAFATELVPGKVKFTSQQGRQRRLRLLNAAKDLLCERAADDISLADVCHRAGIPRASAYHFFPNIQSVFLGLRVLHAHALLNAVQAVSARRSSTPVWR